MKGDEEIIESVRKGERASYLEVLYKRTFPKIKNYIKKNGGNLEEVEDIFQDAIVIFVQKVRDRSFNEKYDIDGFIYTISRNLWINRAKIKSRTVFEEEIRESQETGKDHLSYLISDEKANFVNQILGRLGDSCRDLLTLTILKEYSLKEVAETLGYSNEGVAKTYSYRCRQKLIQLVNQEPSLLQAFDR